MAIEYVKRLAGPYVGEGQSTFTFGFLIFKTTDVYVATALSNDEASTILENGVDYTVQMNDDQNSTPGGTITLSAPLIKNQIVVIGSCIAYTQELQLTNYTRFPPEQINMALDRIVIQIQQIVEKLGRTVCVPETSSKSSEEIISDIYTAWSLSKKLLDFKEAIIRVASVSNKVEVVSDHIDSIIKIAEHLDELLSIDELYPLINQAKQYAERAEVASKTALEAAESVKKFEELYPDFILLLDRATKLLDEFDDIQLSILNTASSHHAAFGREVLRDHYDWEINGIRQLKYLTDIALTRLKESEFALKSYDQWVDNGLKDIAVLSVTSQACNSRNFHTLSEYNFWLNEGWAQIEKLRETSFQTRKQNEKNIWIFDDDVRVKNLLIRTYVEKPHLLFIVAGQSNAVGTGPSPGYEDASYCAQYWDWKDQAAKSLKPLKDPVYRSVKGSAWPSFARIMFERTGRKIIILNIASGGADVTGINLKNTWYQDEIINSPLRTIATREWTELIAELKANSVEYEIAGMMWIQGEAECGRIGAGIMDVQEYINGTLDVFSYFRTLTEQTELPIYMAQIGYTKTVLTNAELLKGYEAVRSAQLKLCRENKNDFMACELAGSYFKAGYMQDSIHYNQRGYNSMGAAFARFISNQQFF